ncbi:hypothetical protein HDU86_005255 [Geranomyces michiganensis]|nr:hypothetical protein HDU86_005255 [Geranomyces michiganensis]
MLLPATFAAARTVLVPLAAFLSITFVSASSLSSAKDTNAASLYIHTSQPAGVGIREVSWEDALSVVANSVAASAGLPHVLTEQNPELLESTVKELNIDLLGKPAANLWIVIEDYPESEAILAKDASYRVRGGQDSASDLLKFGARTADAIAAADSTAWPIVVSSEKSLAGHGPASRVFVGPQEVKVTSSQRLPADMKRTIQEIADTTYVDMEGHALEKFGKKAQPLSSHISADAQLMGELEFSTSMLEAVDAQRILNRAHPKPLPTFISLTFSGLRSLREHYGENSKQFRSGTAMTRAAVDEIVKTFVDMHEGEAVVQVLTVPPSISAALFRRASSATTTSACPTSVADCQSTFLNCSNHGSCTLHNVTATQQCYRCTCSTKWTDDNGKAVAGFSGPVIWTGASCQYQDISVPFQILFWTTVGLIIVTIFVVGLLSSVGTSGAGADSAGAGMRSKTE